MAESGFSIPFRPRLYSALRGYRREDFAADLAAGVTVAIVALPLAMAFGIASGVRPEQGIATAIVAGFLISLLGGSRVQIGGPAGAFVALLYTVAEKYGVANLLIATMMAGVLLFVMGVLRLGTLVRFIPVAVISGFTSGIAVIIAISQVRDFLGIDVDRMPANFFSQIAVIGDRLHTFNPHAVIIGGSCLLVIAAWPVSYRDQPRPWKRLVAKFPGTLAVLLLSALAVWALDIPTETLGSRFGELPRGLPAPRFPEFDWASAQNLFAPTVAIALLGAIESLLCARVADGMIGERHDPNQELMAQGIANFVAPLFGGFAATGTLARTVTNVRSGARTPVAGIVHAATLFAIVLLLAPLAMHIPLAALAAILLWVAYNMGNWRDFPRLRQFSRFYQVIMLSTFAFTVIFDVSVAVQVGLVLASLFFIYRISQLTTVEPIELAPTLAALPGGRTVGAYRLFGSLFFGSVSKLEALIREERSLPDVVILEMHQVISLDTTAMEAFEHIHEAIARNGGILIVVSPNEQPLGLMRRSGFLERIGRNRIYETIEDALDDLSHPDAAAPGAR